MPSCLTATHGDGVRTDGAAQTLEALNRPRTSMGALRQGSIPGKAFSDRHFPRGKSYGNLIRIARKQRAAKQGSPAPQLAPFANENRPRVMRLTLSRSSTGASPLLTEANVRRLSANQNPLFNVLTHSQISSPAADQAEWGSAKFWPAGPKAEEIRRTAPGRLQAGLRHVAATDWLERCDQHGQLREQQP